MSLPKRKKSKSKTRMRRSHMAIKPKSTSTCPRCAEPKLPHRVCIHCGHYRDKEIIKMEQF